MDDQTGQILALLRRDKVRLTATRDSLDTVCNSVESIIDRCYSKDSSHKAKVKLITSRTSIKTMVGTVSPFGDTFESLKNDLDRLIDNIVSEIENLGLPSARDLRIDKSVNVTNNVSQVQNFEVNLIQESLKNELTGKQIKEINQIISEEKDIEKAKGKIGEKLKSFGGDIAVNVLTSILTNPTYWTMLQ